MITPEETAELERLLADATPAPWIVRPHETDDWGYMRGPVNAEGWRPVVAIARGGDGKDYDAHRRAGTDPYGPNAALIVFLRNHATALLAAARQAEAKDARIAELEAALRIVALERYVVGTIFARLADPSPNAGGGDAG